MERSFLEGVLDRVHEVKQRQIEFQRLCDIDLFNPDEKLRISEGYLFKAAEEVFELIKTIPSYFNRNQKTVPLIDRERILHELSDVALFLINFSIVWGISSEEFLDSIEEVQKRNFSKFLTKRRDKMLQEFYKNEPLKFFLCCIALNRSRGETAREVMAKFFLEFPDPIILDQSYLGRVKDIVAPLGFYSTKPINMINLCECFRDMKLYQGSRYLFSRQEILGLPGLGKYAADCYEAICLGNVHTNLSHYKEPLDSRLRDYLVEKAGQLQLQQESEEV
jgi:NTP pyrophosphatase (non-canonical NTP hydrolase)